jgi:hypothetical protein
MRRRELLRRASAAGALGATAAVGAGAVDGITSGDGGASDDNGSSDQTVESDGPFPAAQPAREDPEPYEDYAVHRVPAAFDTIQAAVNAASPGDLVLVEPGTYTEAVRVTDTPRLTIRGTDRNGVVLDGEFQREDGVLATVDDVVVENMTARHYVRNGFFWSSVRGWRGSYLTAYNNGVYGVYNIASQHGRYDHCYASGHPDSGFYIGQCKPCHAMIEQVRAEHNAIGYSGTNAGGYLTVRDSLWRRNMGGIVPNSLDSEANPPQTSARIENNRVESNAYANAPDVGFGYATFGTGITVAGGEHNEIVGNTVRNHPNFGMVAVPMVDENVYPPAGNRFVDNDVSNSGRADLAVGAPQDGGNVFAGNDAETARPTGLNGGPRVAGGDPWVTLVLFEQYTQLDRGEAPSGDWQSQPEPPFDELESMPEAESAPPRPAVRRPDG